jgi:4'-phosphopantetheinyl transferase
MIYPFPAWCLPAETPVLGNDEVHVWRAALEQPASRVRRLFHTLSAGEQTRADRFFFKRDRDHFIVARGVLRILLGRYLDRDPGRLRFCYSSHGKPALARECGRDGLRFNLSHSHGLALFAIAWGRILGIDLERIRPDMANDQIAEQFFSPREIAMLRALPKNMETEAFFTCWTRKEAYIKARGEGLSLPLDEFDVSLAPGKPAELLGTRGHPNEVSRWSLQELVPGPGYVAALAVEGPVGQLKCWQLPDWCLVTGPEAG